MAPRDVQLIVIGMLAMDRELRVDDHWFDCDLRQLIRDLKERKASQRTVQWLEYRGVNVSQSFGDDVMATVERMAKPSLLKAAAELLATQQNGKHK